MKTKLFCLIILTLTFFTCTDEKPSLVTENNLIYNKKTGKPYTGKVEGNAGENYVEFQVVEGKKEGTYLLKDKNGNILMHGEMKNNMNWGEWNYYYPNGNLESKGSFSENEPEGKWEFYYEDGTLKEEGFFLEGKRTGEWKFYSTAGKLDSVKNFSE